MRSVPCKIAWYKLHTEMEPHYAQARHDASGADPKDLAKASGVTYQNILHILKTGKTKNSTMKRIAEALRYPIEFFIIPGDMDDSPSSDTCKDRSSRRSNTAYDQLNKAIEDRLAVLGDNRSLLRYWLAKDLREHFNVRSYTLVTQTNLDEALALIKIWEPGKGFKSDTNHQASA